MVKRLATLRRRLHKNPKICNDLLLSGETGEGVRPQNLLYLLLSLAHRSAVCVKIFIHGEKIIDKITKNPSNVKTFP